MGAMTIEASSIEIHVLGTGAADPSPDRANTSFILQLGSEQLMLDCSGSPAKEYLSRFGSLETLNLCVLSHEHTDHIYGVPSLIHSSWLAGGVHAGKRLRFLGPATAIQKAKGLSDVMALETRTMPVVLTWEELSHDKQYGVVVDLPVGRVEYFWVNHGGTDAIGVAVLPSEGSPVLLSCDSEADQNMRNHIDHYQAAVLVHDCGAGFERSRGGHAGVAEVLDLARQCRSVRRLYLSHLPPLDPSQLQQMVGDATANDDFVVRVLRDGDVVRPLLPETS